MHVDECEEKTARRDVTKWARYSCRRDNSDSSKKIWDKFSQRFAVGVTKGTTGMPVRLFSIIRVLKRAVFRPRKYKLPLLENHMYRIGIGYDVHRLVKRRKLVLGGVKIPSDRGLLGHSDADVLVHAVCDGLLGALGLKDIGAHFPNSDPAYKDISSLILLRKVAQLLKKADYSVVNIDTVVLAQQPRLAPLRTKMAQKLARVLDVPSRLINIKATTTEGLGEIGQAKAIAAYAAVLLRKGSK